VTTPADELRTAATAIRQRAEAATPGPWTSTGIGDFGWTVGAPTRHVAESEDSEQGRADADYIAAMHPGVGLLLANWLDSWDNADIDEHAAMPDDLRHALLIARTLNGGQP
jgi:hypothetical protein